MKRVHVGLSLPALLLLPALLFAAVIQSGATTDLLIVDPTRKAGRVTTEPNEALGHYSLAQGTLTGIATVAADAEVFQFRNSTSTKVIIERITLQLVLVAAITTGQEVAARVEKATSWTVQGTGGTALDAENKRRETMAASAMATGDVRIATTAALGAGTKTIATVPMYICGFQLNAFTVGNMSQVCEVETRDNKYSLLVLDQNEGFVIRNVIAFATGTGKWIVNVQWREATTY